MSLLNMTDTERYHHELPQYRKRVVEMQDKINDLNYLVHKVFCVLEDLWNNPELVMDPEFRVSYKHIKEDVEDVDISKAQLTLKNAIESVEELQNLTKAQAQDIHDLQMQTSAQAAIIERLKKEVQK